MSDLKRRIFIVDDHSLVREWLATLVREELDLEVCGQADAAPPALAGMIATRPDIAMVDLSLRGGSGLDLIKDLHIQCPSTQVVVLSMHEEIGLVERVFRAGARAYVAKRDSTQNIIDAIRTVISGRVYAQPHIIAQLTERMVGQQRKQPGNMVDLLSDREMEVFRRLGGGQATRKIAAELGLTIKTVQSYSARIKLKLGLANATELISEASRWCEKNQAN